MLKEAAKVITQIREILESLVTTESENSEEPEQETD